MEPRVLVVGGGIGGLAAATALRRADIPVTVFERSPELLAIGGAIQIWANGMAALRELGVADRVRVAGSPVEKQEFRSSTGARLFSTPLGEMASRNGIEPPVLIRRGELLKILADGAGPETIRFGSECVAFEQDVDGVTVTLADGSIERGTALVAAEGIDSRIRRTLQPDVEPRFAGYQYLRAISRFDEFPAGVFLFTLGRRDRIGIHHVAPGLVYWFGVLINPPGSGDPPAGRKAELLERFGRFPEPVPSIIEATPESDIGRTDIRDLKPLSRWSDGRVTLLGDAAHATTPNLGRGSGEALEDALALARLLADGAETVAALRKYDEVRRPASAVVQTRSHRLGATLARTNPLVARAREFGFKHFASRGMLRGTEREFAQLGSRHEASVEAPAAPASGG